MEEQPGALAGDFAGTRQSDLSKTELLKILKTAVGSRPKADASLILADQLIAAKLNIANNSDHAPIVSTIADTDSLLRGFSGKLPYKVKTTSATGGATVNDAAYWTITITGC